MFYNNSIFRSKIGPKPFMQYRETVIEISLTFYMKFLYQDFHIKCKKDVNNLHILCQEYTFSALAVLVGWEESIQHVKTPCSWTSQRFPTVGPESNHWWQWTFRPVRQKPRICLWHVKNHVHVWMSIVLQPKAVCVSEQVILQDDF